MSRVHKSPEEQVVEPEGTTTQDEAAPKPAASTVPQDIIDEMCAVMDQQAAAEGSQDISGQEDEDEDDSSLFGDIPDDELDTALDELDVEDTQSSQATGLTLPTTWFTRPTPSLTLPTPSLTLPTPRLTLPNPSLTLPTPSLTLPTKTTNIEDSHAEVPDELFESAFAELDAQQGGQDSQAPEEAPAPPPERAAPATPAKPTKGRRGGQTSRGQKVETEFDRQSRRVTIQHAVGYPRLYHWLEDARKCAELGRNTFKPEQKRRWEEDDEDRAAKRRKKGANTASPAKTPAPGTDPSPSVAIDVEMSGGQQLPTSPGSSRETPMVIEDDTAAGSAATGMFPASSQALLPAGQAPALGDPLAPAGLAHPAAQHLSAPTNGVDFSPASPQNAMPGLQQGSQAPTQPGYVGGQTPMSQNVGMGYAPRPGVPQQSVMMAQNPGQYAVSGQQVFPRGYGVYQGPPRRFGGQASGVSQGLRQSLSRPNYARGYGINPVQRQRVGMAGQQGLPFQYGSGGQVPAGQQQHVMAGQPAPRQQQYAMAGQAPHQQAVASLQQPLQPQYRAPMQQPLRQLPGAPVRQQAAIGRRTPRQQAATQQPLRPVPQAFVQQRGMAGMQAPALQPFQQQPGCGYQMPPQTVPHQPQFHFSEFSRVTQTYAAPPAAPLPMTTTGVMFPPQDTFQSVPASLQATPQTMPQQFQGMSQFGGAPQGYRTASGPTVGLGIPQGGLYQPAPELDGQGGQ
ncbi:hypothetical protein QBC41DRAFT_386549 [Cercophora samala]|uniref:Uncharacterized protein n=1 Tax=Cercophora samala TaxID=330535 RepID=A0AA39YKC2_9PEZI|nr:hypothetical protein QBC41DRAFT_386549 [Cercophora samala]